MAIGLLVADTDVLIDYLRGAEPGAGFVRRRLVDGTLRVTAVSVFELRQGLGGDSGDADRTLAPLVTRRTVPLDLGAALVAGRVAADLRGAGTPIGVADTLIAGVCLRRGLPLATRNVRHLGRVPGLVLVDPAQPPA